VYDLRTWGAGLCHTYSPPRTSRTDLASRLTALLGSSAKRGYYVQGFDIYIHEEVSGLYRAMTPLP
jgi:hypothetical protein